MVTGKLIDMSLDIDIDMSKEGHGRVHKKGHGPTNKIFSYSKLREYNNCILRMQNVLEIEHTVLLILFFVCMWEIKICQSFACSSHLKVFPNEYSFLVVLSP